MSDKVQLDKALNLRRLKSSLPARPTVRRITHAPYVDSLGARELMIHVVLANDTTDDDMAWANLQVIKKAITHAIRDDDRFPYFRFLTEAELEESDEE